MGALKFIFSRMHSVKFSLQLRNNTRIIIGNFCSSYLFLITSMGATMTDKCAKRECERANFPRSAVFGLQSLFRIFCYAVKLSVFFKNCF